LETKIGPPNGRRSRLQSDASAHFSFCSYFPMDAINSGSLSITENHSPNSLTRNPPRPPLNSLLLSNTPSSSCFRQAALLHPNLDLLPTAAAHTSLVRLSYQAPICYAVDCFSHNDQSSRPPAGMTRRHRDQCLCSVHFLTFCIAST
jgi:hypothetical protein